MADPYLAAMMHGEIVHRKKDKFDEAITREIKRYVDSLPPEEASNNQLVSPEMKRIRLIEELKEEVKMPELSAYIEKAFSFLQADGLQYLDQDSFKMLQLAFKNSAKLLAELDLSQEMSKDYQELLGFSNEVMDLIYQVAIGSYQAERFEESLSLFMFLVTLNPANPDYWFRNGIAAQKTGLIDIALKSYATTSTLAPDLIGAKLFAAECHLANGSQKEAAVEVEESKKIKESIEIEPMWLELLELLEGSIEKP